MNNEIPQFQVLIAQRSCEISRIGRAGMGSSVGPIKEVQGELYILVKGGIQGEEKGYASSHGVNSKWK